MPAELPSLMTVTSVSAETPAKPPVRRTATAMLAEQPLWTTVANASAGTPAKPPVLKTATVNSAETLTQMTATNASAEAPARNLAHLLTSAAHLSWERSVVG